MRKTHPFNHLLWALCLCEATVTEDLRSVSPALPPVFFSFFLFLFPVSFLFLTSFLNCSSLNEAIG